MSERTEEDFKKFLGTPLERSIFRVKGREMVKYALAIGDENPKYVGVKQDENGKDDYSGIVAHPAFPATFTVGALFKLADAAGEDGKPLIKNIGKLLHTGHVYNYEGCEPIVDGLKLYTSGEITNIFIKSNILWIEISMETRNKEEDKLYCKCVATVGIRKGGY
jgi:hypothetical protein